MCGDGFEQSTILRTGPDGLTRVITRTSWARRESGLVEAYAAELPSPHETEVSRELVAGLPSPTRSGPSPRRGAKLSDRQEQRLQNNTRCSTTSAPR